MVICPQNLDDLYGLLFFTRGGDRNAYNCPYTPLYIMMTPFPKYYLKLFNTCSSLVYLHPNYLKLQTMNCTSWWWMMEEVVDNRSPGGGDKTTGRNQAACFSLLFPIPSKNSKSPPTRKQPTFPGDWSAGGRPSCSMEEEECMPRTLF